MIARRRFPHGRQAEAIRASRDYDDVQEWIPAAIGVAGTLSGTGLGYRGSLAISRRQGASALRDQIRSALAEYLGALYVSVAELRAMPSNIPLNLVDRAINDLRGERATWLAGRRAEYKMSGDRYRDVAGRLAAATARLQVLPLPSEIRAAVDAANDYVDRLGEDRPPELKAEWPEIHARLMAAAETLDAEGRDKSQ